MEEAELLRVVEILEVSRIDIVSIAGIALNNRIDQSTKSQSIHQATCCQRPKGLIEQVVESHQRLETGGGSRGLPERTPGLISRTYKIMAERYNRAQSAFVAKAVAEGSEEMILAMPVIQVISRVKYI